MKLTAVLLLGVCMQIYAAGYGQKITLSERDVPIEKVLKKIQQQTSYKFLYTSQLLSGVPKVTVVVKDATVQDVLDLVLKGQMLDYEVSESTVVIKPRRELPVKQVTQLNMPDPIEVRGVITDENGAPAAGVNVMVKGTSKGTTTNLRGEFVLRDVSENAVLLITSVGYDRQEILVKGKAMVNTQLKVAVGNLDEMQVIAYGKTSKRFNTGNISSVKAIDIEKQPVQNPLLTLQGRVPGLFITQSSGVPGAGVTVRIQGQNSIRNGNDPFYVVDGVPFIAQFRNSGIEDVLGQSGASQGGWGSGNPLNYINPSDIESVEILKDADATAIYGSRGANGAILITTKKGKVGAMNVTFNVQQGVGKVGRKIEMLNTEQYLKMRHEALVNDGINVTDADYDINGLWDTTRYTDWQRELIGGHASFSSYNLSLTGGSNTLQYVAGGTFYNEKTVFPGNFSDKKGSFHFSINSTSNDKRFKTTISTNYMADNNELPQTDLTQMALQLEPNAPSLYNSDGTLNWAEDNTGTSTFDNPLKYFYVKYKNKTTSLVSNAVFSYEVIKGLEIKSSFGYTNLRVNDFSSIPLVSIKPEERASSPREAYYGNRVFDSWIIEPQATYSKVISRGKIDFLLGFTVQQNKTTGSLITGVGYSNDLRLEDIKSATAIFPSNSFETQYKYNAAFSRVSLNWAERYLLNFTIRRDGSSRFGAKNRFHNFGSIAVGWIFSEENYLKNIEFVSFGKLRASYGITGNDQIADYGYLNLYNPVNNGISYQGVASLAPNGLTNPYLQWEQTKKIQTGLDIGLINDRFLFSLTYARNKSSNQLLSYVLPLITGRSSIISNFPATVENSSWEFSLQVTNVVRKKISWRSNINLTIPKNKLIEFPNISTSSYSGSLIIGEPISIIQAFKFYSVDAFTGKYQFVDGQGNLTFSPNFFSDRKTLINILPTFYGGIQNNVTYKGVELDFLFQVVKQIGRNIYFYNRNLYPGQFSSGFSNQPQTVTNRWQKAGDNASIQKFSTARDLYIASSDYTYSDASYIRLKNVSISYNIPKKINEKLHLRNSIIYCHGQNLITITKYKGLDPENQSNTSLPPLKIITVGVKIGL